MTIDHPPSEMGEPSTVTPDGGSTPPAAEGGAAPPVAVGGRRRAFLRFARQQPFGLAALILIVCFVTLAALCPWIAPYDPLTQHRGSIMVPPSAEHWFGTDDLGRDVLSRTLYGARTSLLIAVATLLLGGVIGIVLGTVSGYFGGTWVDTIIQRIMDTLMAIPSIVLLLFIAALLGPSIRNTVIALSLLVIPQFNRVTRGEMLRIREETFIEAARAIGCGPWRILTRYGLPNLMAPLFVLTSLVFAVLMIAESALSFLGIGTPPPTPSWGRMLSEGSDSLEIGPWIALFPGLALSISVLAFNLLGDAMRDFLDPKQRR